VRAFYKQEVGGSIPSPRIAQPGRLHQVTAYVEQNADAILALREALRGEAAKE
jgi:hypothetical protein